MLIPANKGIEVSYVADFQNNGDNIEVTFKAAKGYKFRSGTSKIVKIYFSGNFTAVHQTIIEDPFTTAARGQSSGQAGMSQITFNSGFIQNGVSSFNFHPDDKGNLDGRKAAAIAGLNEMFIENNSAFGGDYPEGVRYAKNHVRIKKKPNGKDDVWSDGSATLIVTFIVQDDLYIFKNGKNTREVEIRFVGTM